MNSRAAQPEIPGQRVRPPPPSRSRFAWLPWILLPVLFFGAINLALRQLGAHRSGWYHKVERTVAEGRLDYLLVGSSRTAAAIDVDLLESELTRLGGRKVRVQSLARGNISLVHTLLALRRLAAAQPGRLQGMVLVFELPGGLPPVFGTWKDTARGWDSEWAEVGKNPQLLARVLDAPQLVRFWESPTSFEAKSAVTVRWALRELSFFDEQERIRDEFISAGNKLTRQLLGVRTRGEELDLASEGGIRTDAEAAQQVQATVVEEAERLALDSRPYGYWEQSLLPELVAIANREGMKIAFLRIPQSALLDRASTTPVRLEDTHRFRQLVTSWDAAIVEFPFPVVDADFPDGLHLRQTRSGPFSRELARALTEGADS